MYFSVMRHKSILNQYIFRWISAIDHSNMSAFIIAENKGSNSKGELLWYMVDSAKVADCIQQCLMDEHCKACISFEALRASLL